MATNQNTLLWVIIIIVIIVVIVFLFNGSKSREGITVSNLQGKVSPQLGPVQRQQRRRRPSDSDDGVDVDSDVSRRRNGRGRRRRHPYRPRRHRRYPWWRRRYPRRRRRYPRYPNYPYPPSYYPQPPRDPTPQLTFPSQGECTQDCDYIPTEHSEWGVPLNWRLDCNTKVNGYPTRACEQLLTDSGSTTFDCSRSANIYGRPCMREDV